MATSLQLVWIVVVASAIVRPTNAEPPASDDDRILPPVALPAAGGVPFVVDPGHISSIAELARLSRHRLVAEPLRRIARSHFGRRRDLERRALGIDAIREHRGAASLFAMPIVFADEDEDVRRSVLRHLAESGDVGQAAIVHAAVHHEDRAWRRAALDACPRPLGASALAVLEAAFRNGRRDTVDRAAVAAGGLEARRMLPHLIAAQYTADSGRARGDLAWIAIGTQRTYIQNLIPVAGGGSGAFRPVPGIINEGVVLRVTDAVAVTYRTEIHRVLVDMTSSAAGYDTASHGWRYDRWRAWYNEVELPRTLAEAEARTRVRAAEAFAETARDRRRKAAEAAILD